ncbi:MAG: response receiver [Verrucomicrobiales bacterium]|nr:response receiver [Verrucomicrobiales bacterium]
MKVVAGGLWAGPVAVGLKSVLVVDNEAEHCLRIRQELRHLNLRNHVRCVTSAAEMISYLNGFAQFHDREEYPLPALLLVDLNLPLVDGFIVVEWIRSHERFCHIPIVVMGRPNQVGALEAAVKVGADAFMIKPFNRAQFEWIVMKMPVLLEFNWNDAFIDQPLQNRPV